MVLFLTEEDEKAEAPKKDAPANTETINVAEISFNDIILLLHEKAMDLIKGEKDFTILNSAIDSEKKAFYGAGSHIIAALPKEKSKDKEKDKEIEAEKALELITTYIQWFVGPDLKSSIEIKDLVPMEKGKELEGDKKEDTTKKTDDTETNNESTIYVPSFSQFLILEDDDPTKSVRELNKDKKAAEKKAIEDEKKKKEDKKKELLDKKADQDKKANSTSAPGYYIAYKMQIEGQKEHTIADALKKLGSDILKGFGVKFGNWRTGSEGEAHTLGDLKDALDSLTQIDPNKLQQDFDANIKKEFPQSEVATSIFDTKTIINHLKKHLAGSDKGKIRTSELALCVKVNKNDKSYKLFNQKKIAKVVMKSLGGFLKKVKNTIMGKDVVLVNNYSDATKHKEDNKYKSDKEEGTVADSIIIKRKSRIIAEADDKKEDNDSEKTKRYLDTKELSETLKGIAKQLLKDKFLDAMVSKPDAIINMLKKLNISDNDVLGKLKKCKDAFYIKTKEPKTDSALTLDTASLNVPTNLINLLFEEGETDKDKDKDKDKKDKKSEEANKKQNKEVLNSIKSIFSTFLNAVNKKHYEGKAKFKDITDITRLESPNKLAESMNVNNKYSLFKLYFEDANSNIFDQLLREDDDKKNTIKKEDFDKFKEDAIKELEKIAKAEFAKINTDGDDYVPEVSIVDGNGSDLPDVGNEIKDKMKDNNFNLVIKVKNTDSDYNGGLKKAAQDTFDKFLGTGEYKDKCQGDGSLVSESIFDDLVLTEGRKADHINQLIDKVGTLNIVANKDKIIASLREYYSNNKDALVTKKKLLGVSKKTKEEEWNAKRIKGWNKKHPDDKREVGYKEEVVVRDALPGIIDDFFKLSDEEAMKNWVNSEFAEIGKADDGEKIVQAFWKALSLLLEKKEDEKTTIQFYTTIDNENEEKFGDPVEIEDPKNAKEEDLKYPDEDRLKEFAEKNKAKVLKDPFDPKAEDLVKDLKLGENKVTINFISDDDGDGGDEDEKALTTFVMPRKIEFDLPTVQFKVPKDPSKPDGDTEDVGDPVPFEEGKELTPPEPPDHTKDGYEFDKWTPDPKGLKELPDPPEIIGSYKESKKDDEKPDKPTTTTVYYIAIDENGIIDPSGQSKEKENSISNNSTDLDFYIVPIKGLKYKDDDKK